MKSSMNPIQLWGRSLPFRVVLSTLAASVVILLLTGWFLMEQSTRGIIEGKTQASIAEASAVMTSMQRDLSTTDLRTTSLGERITRLGRDATNRGQTGNQYYVAIETPISQIGSAGVSAASIPANIRNAVNSAGSLWSTPTLIQFTDNRPAEPGLVVAGELIAPGQGAYPVYFLFPTTQERQTIAVVQQAALATGVILLAGLGVVVYVMVVQVLRPVRAARLAAERLAAGHLDDRMAVEGVEDLAGLARSMNHMAAELEHKVGELEELSTVQQRFVS
ncbi:MAG TPA: two-component sensor histidine kinase, partial [Propionibacteriaceae bacterium]|nr:two-component sensor histidine kinase [Propionibacteriaceae bacterium]